ncbi:hypothetical protein [Streptomyces collinus]
MDLRRRLRLLLHRTGLRRSSSPALLDARPAEAFTRGMREGIAHGERAARLRREDGQGSELVPHAAEPGERG